MRQKEMGGSPLQVVTDERQRALIQKKTRLTNILRCVHGVI